MPTTDKINRVHNLRQRLRKRPRDVSLRHIAAHYGFTLDWLKTFHAGRHPNPHTRYLDKLEAALNDIRDGASA